MANQGNFSSTKVQSTIRWGVPLLEGIPKGGPLRKFVYFNLFKFFWVSPTCDFTVKKAAYEIQPEDMKVNKQTREEQKGRPRHTVYCQD